MNNLINNAAQTSYVPKFRRPRTKDIPYGAVIRSTAPTGPGTENQILLSHLWPGQLTAPIGCSHTHQSLGISGSGGHTYAIWK